MARSFFKTTSMNFETYYLPRLVELATWRCFAGRENLITEMDGVNLYAGGSNNCRIIEQAVDTRWQSCRNFV